METLKSALLELCSKPRTTHFITTSLFQLNEVLMSHFKKTGLNLTDLNIHSASIHNHISCVGSSLMTEKNAHPHQDLMNLERKRIINLRTSLMVP